MLLLGFLEASALKHLQAETKDEGRKFLSLFTMVYVLQCCGDPPLTLLDKFLLISNTGIFVP